MTELLTAITGKWMDPILWACIPLFFLLVIIMGGTVRRQCPEYAAAVNSVGLFVMFMCLHVIRYCGRLVAAGLKACPVDLTDCWLVLGLCVACILFLFGSFSRFAKLRPGGLRAIKLAFGLYPILIAGIFILYSLWLPVDFSEMATQVDVVGHILGALIVSLPWLVYLHRSKQTIAVWTSVEPR